MNRSKCVGCDNNGYNYGLGGSTECWCLKNAKLIRRKEVRIDQVPPWKQKARMFPNCYRMEGYVYVQPNQTR